MPASPCATINGAIAKAFAGDVIKIAQGTFRGTGTQPVVTVGNNLTLSGGWDNTFTTQSGFSVIDGQNVRKCVSSSGSTIDHFKIMNGYTASSSGGAGISTGGGLNLSNSLVVGNRTSSSENGAGGIYAWSGILTINNSTVRGNAGGGIYVKDFNLPLSLQ